METIQKYCGNKIEDIFECLNLTLDSIDVLDEEVRKKIIPDCSIKRQDSDLITLLTELNELNEIKTTIENTIKHLLKKITVSPEEQETMEENEPDDNVLNRTSYQVNDGVIRVITKRVNSNDPYTNNIPIELFKEIAVTILEQFERYNRTSISTSTITTIMGDTIKENSRYKSSPGQLIYRCMLVLLLKGLILRSPDHSRRYIQGMKQEEYMQALENIISN